MHHLHCPNLNLKIANTSIHFHLSKSSDMEYTSSGGSSEDTAPAWRLEWESTQQTGPGAEIRGVMARVMRKSPAQKARKRGKEGEYI